MSLTSNRLKTSGAMPQSRLPPRDSCSDAGYQLDYVACQLRAHAHFLSHQLWLDRNVSLVLHALGWDTAN
jgi:hypothetical protein